MLKLIPVTVVFINAIASASLALPAHQSVLIAKSNPPKIGIIQNPQLLPIRGTYCDLHRLTDKSNSNRDVLISVYQSQYKSKALMNIDGKDTILSSVQETKNERGSVAIYQTGNLKVKVNYLRTSPEMEGASYDATIVIHRGKSKTTLKTTGSCGI